MTFDELPAVDFPLKKRFDGDRFAYIVLLSLGRARINITTLQKAYEIEEFY